jgi:hypothetical protein
MFNVSLMHASMGTLLPVANIEAIKSAVRSGALLLSSLPCLTCRPCSPARSPCALPARCSGLDSIALGWMQPVFDGLRKWFGVRLSSALSRVDHPSLSAVALLFLLFSTSTSLIRSACRGTAAARSRCSPRSDFSWVRSFPFYPFTLICA